eukprot:8597125-Pyramimonas_sp.AAC.1
MDFQQLLSRLADEHSKLKQEKDEFAEEVYRLRQKLQRGGSISIPGQVSSSSEPRGGGPVQNPEVE